MKFKRLLKEYNEEQKLIKDFSKIMIGDIAYENPDAGGEWDKKIGKIVWKGTFKDALRSNYRSSAKEILDQYSADEDIQALNDDYEWVIVKENSIYGKFTDYVMYNYNGDPSGVVCFDNNMI